MLECGVAWCEKSHHRMFQTDTSQHKQRSIRIPTSEGLGHEIDDSMDIVPVRLRTVLVVLKSVSKRVTINALLDDASIDLM